MAMLDDKARERNVKRTDSSACDNQVLILYTRSSAAAKFTISLDTGFLFQVWHNADDIGNPSTKKYANTEVSGRFLVCV